MLGKDFIFVKLPHPWRRTIYLTHLHWYANKSMEHFIEKCEEDNMGVLPTLEYDTLYNNHLVQTMYVWMSMYIDLLKHFISKACLQSLQQHDVWIAYSPIERLYRRILRIPVPGAGVVRFLPLLVAQETWKWRISYRKLPMWWVRSTSMSCSA